jgi:glycosyltransferase involved in cell wall biosynthesis
MKFRILGIRGVPAAHGGFETFAEELCRHLVANDWRPVVYCQEEGSGAPWRDEWNGVERIHIPVAQAGPLGTIIFDWKCMRDAAQAGDPCLVLGYNTAMFVGLLRLRGVPNVINMDGIEWARAKWGPIAKLWFWLNDWAGCWLGGHLIADHPEIKRHLSTRTSDKRITMIPYGAHPILNADSTPLDTYGLRSRCFLTVIARAEPENSLLEIVEGFSRIHRGVKLVVLGNYDATHPYQRRVLEAASDEVIFLGAIYDSSIVQALRWHSLAYVHGHQVGGTNPSLVEALGAGNAIFAHDNRFNRWVAGDGAKYFSDGSSFSALLDDILEDEVAMDLLRTRSRARFESNFKWPDVLNDYQSLLARIATPVA